MNNAIKLILSIAIPLAVGFTSSFFTITGVGSWYQTIQLPSWNPPDWIFGPVWTTLYMMMGIAFYLIWKANTTRNQKNYAILMFVLQLIFNFFWSFIFFNQHEPGWAFTEIVALWILILVTIFTFAKINNIAAWLLVPYISWVSFAAILNYTIWKLNS